MTLTGVMHPENGSARPGRRHPGAMAAALACEAVLFACDDRDPSADDLPPPGEMEELARCVHPVSTLDGPRSYVYTVDWSPIDDLVLAGTDQELRLITVDSEAEELAVAATYADHPKFSFVRWSSDGRFALAAGGEVSLLAITRDPPAISALATYTDHHGDVYAVAWSPDGTHALTGGKDATVRLLAVNAAEGSISEQAIYYGHFSKVQAVAWAPDGRHAVSAGNDGTVRLLAVDLDPPALRELAVEFNSDEESTASWTPSGDMVLTGTWAMTHVAQVWSFDVDAGALHLMSEFADHPSGVSVLEWSHDGERIATAGHEDTVRLSAFADGELTSTGILADYTAGVHSVSWSRDESHMIMAASRADRISLLDASDCPR